MIGQAQNFAKRDRRLLISIAFLIISVASFSYQALIIKLYIDGAVTGNWDYFSKTFSAPLLYGPNQACFDYCAPELPFVWGWIGIVSVLLGVATLAYSWWKPQSPGGQ
ncbi:hypothetical protein [Erythrobacter aureus]|uniref:hypothetical protein n=1 Tax=Erythrobacter aureus TaxID=2182384 RepID=UPI0013B3D608|nr:hypothetical protein [Erythrobacter aureus]